MLRPCSLFSQAQHLEQLSTSNNPPEAMDARWGAGAFPLISGRDYREGAKRA
jgi:hypothetical protein